MAEALTCLSVCCKPGTGVLHLYSPSIWCLWCAKTLNH